MERPSKFLQVGDTGFYYFNDSGESNVTKAYDDTKERPFMKEMVVELLKKIGYIWFVVVAMNFEEALSN